MQHDKCRGWFESQVQPPVEEKISVIIRFLNFYRCKLMWHDERCEIMYVKKEEKDFFFNF